MDLSDEAQRAGWRRYLSEPLTGRPVIAGLAPLAALTDWVRLLAEVGARPPLLVATGVGAGAVPTGPDAQVVMVDAGEHESMTALLRDQERLARHLPGHARAAVDRHDPAREGVWLLGPFVLNRPLLGRPVLGGRPAEWLALEDKLRAEEVWDHVGAPHAETAVVPVAEEPLAAACRKLDEGAGTVWAGDARDGFNGGGDFVRWVVTEDDLAAALDFFAPRCDRVRVMPFLDGVPCSVHGIVLPDGTAAFRPVELAIMRGPGRRFVYGGQGSSWDPPEDDRAQMRDLVRRTGEHLRALVGYRGAFGIDGVLTAAGFRPTELNTRFSAGLSALTGPVDHAAFTLLQLNLVAGRDPRVSTRDLESWAVAEMDARRVCKPIMVSHRRVVPEPTQVPVTWDGRTLRRAEPGTGLLLAVAPSATGTFAKVAVDDGLVPPGSRLGPLNVALLRFLDEELGTEFGDVRAAPDVRSRPCG